MAFIASLIFCALYWTMWDTAKLANSEALNRNPDKFKDYPFYETCGMGNETDYHEGPMLILEFASIFYLIYMIIICCLMCFNYFNIDCNIDCTKSLGYFCGFMSFIAQLVLLIISGSVQNSDLGASCSMNEERLIESSDTTFQSQHEEINAIFIA